MYELEGFRYSLTPVFTGRQAKAHPRGGGHLGGNSRVRHHGYRCEKWRLKIPARDA